MHRVLQRSLGIGAVIPEPSDQIRNRQRRGAVGGARRRSTRSTTAGRNVVERAFAHLTQWRRLATRYDKHAVTYRGAAVLRAIILRLKR